MVIIRRGAPKSSLWLCGEVFDLNDGFAGSQKGEGLL